jgi:hypothetical protein
MGCTPSSRIRGEKSSRKCHLRSTAWMGSVIPRDPDASPTGTQFHRLLGTLNTSISKKVETFWRKEEGDFEKNKVNVSGTIRSMELTTVRLQQSMLGNGWSTMCTYSKLGKPVKILSKCCLTCYSASWLDCKGGEVVDKSPGCTHWLTGLSPEVSPDSGTTPKPMMSGLPGHR